MKSFWPYQPLTLISHPLIQFVRTTLDFCHKDVFNNESTLEHKAKKGICYQEVWKIPITDWVVFVKFWSDGSWGTIHILYTYRTSIPIIHCCHTACCFSAVLFDQMLVPHFARFQCNFYITSTLIYVHTCQQLLIGHKNIGHSWYLYRQNRQKWQRTTTNNALKTSCHHYLILWC